MKELKLLIERSPYTARTTSGKLYMVYDGKKEYFCFTLEDAVRPENIKVWGETAIPQGTYQVSLYESPKFGPTIIFHTEDDGVTIIKGVLRWEYVLAHGGNDYSDTEGCLLVAKTRSNSDYIYGSMKVELRQFVEAKIKQGYKVVAEFVNLTQVK